jgi:hypothetical protein
MSEQPDRTEAGKYVTSLKDAVKRRFAAAYLAWIRAGKTGTMPGRGALSPVLAKAVCMNLEALS